MGEIAGNQNSAIILPIPLDLFGPFLEGQDGSGERSRSARLEEEVRRPYEEAVGDAAREVSSEAVPTDMPNGEANR
jgi:hypothetical protein